jgi:hypothetical protein
VLLMEEERRMDFGTGVNGHPCVREVLFVRLTWYSQMEPGFVPSSPVEAVSGFREHGAFRQEMAAALAPPDTERRHRFIAGMVANVLGPAPAGAR